MNVLTLQRRDGSSEFVCLDCNWTVVAFRAPGPPLCAGCEFIRAVHRTSRLTPEQEADMRRRLRCERPADKQTNPDEKCQPKAPAAT